MNGVRRFVPDDQSARARLGQDNCSYYWSCHTGCFPALISNWSQPWFEFVTETDGTWRCWRCDYSDVDALERWQDLIITRSGTPNESLPWKWFTNSVLLSCRPSLLSPLSNGWVFLSPRFPRSRWLALLASWKLFDWRWTPGSTLVAPGPGNLIITSRWGGAKWGQTGGQLVRWHHTLQDTPGQPRVYCRLARKYPATSILHVIMITSQHQINITPVLLVSIILFTKKC